MKVICNDCKKEFAIKKKNIKTEKLFNTVERTYFVVLSVIKSM